MKLKQLLPILLTVSFFSCNKNNSGSNNPNPPGGGGGGTSNDLTITSITPANPYPDDEFIIIGTGFNANATLDTVEFGRLIGTNFGAWHYGPATEWPSLCAVISASTTQLRIKAGNPFGLDYYSFNAPPTSIAIAQVRTGGKKAITPVIPFKRFMSLGFIINPDINNIQTGRPNDSLEINGRGFRATGVTASIDGIPLTSFKVDSVAVTNSKVTLRLPKTFFGVNNDETHTMLKTVVVTNPDGKSVQKDCNFFLSPRMRIYNIYSQNPTYSISALASSGGVINIVIIGACLKNDAVLKVDGDTGVHTQTPFAVSNFPDNITIPFTPGNLVAGSYQATIWRGNTLYTGCNFTVTQ